MEPKERIAVKAHELFMQYGIRSVSMDDIAHQLGMSKKTLYQYYADKDELVNSMIDSHISEIQTDCSHCRVQANDAVHEIFITMERILEDFANMNPMVLYDLEKFHHTAYRRFREHKDQFLYKVVRDNIEWGIKDGLYRQDLDVDVMTRFRLESMMIAFNVTLFPPGKYNLGDITRQFLLHFIYGLATIKGHEQILHYNNQTQKQLSYE